MAIGLGCMRLSTAADRRGDDERAIAVIRTALDAGATLLDTADSYCRDDADVGHNERLIARALTDWPGDRSCVTVATKGGMRRPNGSWVPDGRAKHLRDACDASRRALGLDVIDLYQLHAVDPKTPIETSVRALARLRDDGKVRDVGLCNVTVSQIRAAQSIVPIATVQVSLSPFDDENLRNGVAEYCHDSGIRLIAHRPLGGDRVRQLARDAELSRVAKKHSATSEEVALAWLMSFGTDVVPIPGATRVETANSIARALAIHLDEEDKQAIDARFSGRLLRVPRAQRRPRTRADGSEVVVVMGMPGAGKSGVARELQAAGYERLNRDTLGGSLAGLTTRLDTLLADGTRRVVLDNTYPTRKSRNEVIDTAWQRGATVRCVWLTTDVANAQINAVRRMLDAHGALPTPEEIRERSKADTRFLLPDAQFRYERTLEPPTLDEGFESVEERAFVRDPEQSQGRAVILDFDDLIGSTTPVLDPDGVSLAADRRDALTQFSSDGWLLFVHAWRQVANNKTTLDQLEKCFARLQEQLGSAIDVACCPHEAGPPVCWCRKPIPGSVLEFAARRAVALTRSIVVGTSAADRTMAERIGAVHHRNLNEVPGRAYGAG
jgi:aryl-alcohol dehydrogenase-like predicted oxidoreductase/histidinol phosphatase-like enzyme/predicted kinase